jgi:hypothetical protein
LNIKLPQLILHLIKSCLDANSLNRPNALDLSKIFNKWLDELNAYINGGGTEKIQIELIKTELIKPELVKQVDEIKKKLSAANKLPLANKNFEAPRSKLLNFNNLPKLNYMGPETSIRISESFGFRNIRNETSPESLKCFRNPKPIPNPETSFDYSETSPET